MAVKKKIALMSDTQLFTHLQVQEALGAKIQQLGETVETAKENGDISSAEIEVKRKQYLSVSEENMTTVDLLERELDNRGIKKLGVKHSTLGNFKKLYKYFLMETIVPNQKNRMKNTTKDKKPLIGKELPKKSPLKLS